MSTVCPMTEGEQGRLVRRCCKQRLYGLARVRWLSMDLSFELMRMSGWYKAGRLTTMRAAHWASYVKTSGSELPPRLIAPCRFTPTGPVVAMSKAAKVRGKR